MPAIHESNKTGAFASSPSVRHQGAAELLHALHDETRGGIGIAENGIHDSFPQFVIYNLVRVYSEAPVEACRVHGNVQLRNPSQKRLEDDASTGGGGQLAGAIAALRVDYEHFRRQRQQAIEAALNVLLLVQSQHEDGE